MMRTYTFQDADTAREYHGTVDVRREGAHWSLYVNGQRLVDRESFAVADQIADGIVTPGVHWPSESDEVAQSILRWLRGAR